LRARRMALSAERKEPSAEGLEPEKSKPLRVEG
jgi:hypothetical protein